jgi:hypothetical protein
LGLLCLLCALYYLWFFHIFYIFQLNKRILLVLMWLSGTDFTVPDLVVAAFAKADHRMPGTAYSSGSCKLAAALPQKSVRTVFQPTALNYYYCWFLLYIFYLFSCPLSVIIFHRSILLLFQILLFLVAYFHSE